MFLLRGKLTVSAAKIETAGARWRWLTIVVALNVAAVTLVASGLQ